MQDYEIVNVVGVVCLKNFKPIEMMKLYEILKWEFTPPYFVKFNPYKFRAGIIVKSMNSKVSYLMFESGKIVIAGCKDIEEVHKHAGIIASKLSKHLKFDGYTVEITNIVASVKFKIDFDISMLPYIVDGAEYNSEVFPGVKVPKSDGKTMILLFGNGSAIIPGNRTIEEVEEEIERLNKIISEAKKYIEKIRY